MNIQNFQSHLKKLGVPLDQVETILKIREYKEKLISLKEQEDSNGLNDMDKWEKNILIKKVSFLLEKLDRKNIKYIDADFLVTS